MEFDIAPTPKLAQLSQEALAGISDDDVESSLVHHVVDHMLGDGEGPDALARWPEGLRAWYITFVVDAEVLNGGFNQLFFNSSGALVPAAPWAFERIGSHVAADLMRRALGLLDLHAPALDVAADAGTAEAFLETYRDQPFAELDQQYCQMERELRSARLHFIRERAASLCPPPSPPPPQMNSDVTPQPSTS